MAASIRNCVVLLACGIGLIPEIASAQPAIYYRGIRNAASLSPAALPSGAIARGSIFRISGSAIGPATQVKIDVISSGNQLGGSHCAHHIRHNTDGCDSDFR